MGNTEECYDNSWRFVCSINFYRNSKVQWKGFTNDENTRKTQICIPRYSTDWCNYGNKSRRIISIRLIYTQTNREENRRVIKNILYGYVNYEITNGCRFNLLFTLSYVAWLLMRCFWSEGHLVLMSSSTMKFDEVSNCNILLLVCDWIIPRLCAASVEYQKFDGGSIFPYLSLGDRFLQFKQRSSAISEGNSIGAPK